MFRITGYTSLIAAALVSLVPGETMAGMEDEYKGRIAIETERQGSCLVKMLTDSDIAGLPVPVRHWVQRSGAVNKPVPCELRLEFLAKMWRRPGSAPLAMTASQTSFLREPVRLFYLESAMFGLPIRGLHVYDRGTATMDVRLMGMVPVARASGDTMSVSETVTYLDDLVFFAPFLLADSRLTWTEIDHRSAAVTLSMYGRNVSAVVYFDDSGDVSDLRSEDRSALQPDGSMKRCPWSTPVTSFVEIDGRRLPCRAKVVYDYPDGPFTYGEFELLGASYGPDSSAGGR